MCLLIFINRAPYVINVFDRFGENSAIISRFIYCANGSTDLELNFHIESKWLIVFSKSSPMVLFIDNCLCDYKNLLHEVMKSRRAFKTLNMYKLFK